MFENAKETILQNLWAQVLIGLFLGIITGILLGPDLGLLDTSLAIQISNWLAFPGYLFLAIIKMVVIPLIVSSIICGVASGGSVKVIGKIGANITVYFALTSVVSISMGLLIVTLIAPGTYLDPSIMALTSEVTTLSTNPAIVDSSNIPARIAALIPSNPVDSMASDEMFQVVVFSAFVGAALLFMTQEQGAPFLNLMTSIQQISMVVVEWALKLAPYAVFGLIAQLFTKMGSEALSGIMSYVITILLGLLAIMVFYLLIVALYCRINPIEFLKNVRAAQLIAFSTSSSSATMPVTMKVAETKLGVRHSISRFVVPVGTAVNMDGTAMYQAVATVFLAQAFQLDLSFMDLALVLITAIVASIGTPGTPGVGIVVLATILTTVGVPIEGIAIIIGVDRLLDMCRTVINVTGDLVACSVMEKIMNKK